MANGARKDFKGGWEDMSRVKMSSARKHQKEVNDLIPVAWEEARKRVEKLGVKSISRIGADGKDYSHDLRSAFYHENMNRMTKEAGLRV